MKYACAVLVAAVLVLGWLYNGADTELTETKAELSELKAAYTQAHLKALTDTITVTTAVLAKRDEQYADVKDAGEQTAVAVATAKNTPDSVDIDGFLPLSLSDALIVQQQRVCRGSASCAPAGGYIPPDSPPGSSGAGR